MGPIDRNLKLLKHVEYQTSALHALFLLNHSYVAAYQLSLVPGWTWLCLESGFDYDIFSIILLRTPRLSYMKVLYVGALLDLLSHGSSSLWLQLLLLILGC